MNLWDFMLSDSASNFATFILAVFALIAVFARVQARLLSLIQPRNLSWEEFRSRMGRLYRLGRLFGPISKLILWLSERRKRPNTRFRRIEQIFTLPGGQVLASTTDRCLVELQAYRREANGPLTVRLQRVYVEDDH